MATQVEPPYARTTVDAARDSRLGGTVGSHTIRAAARRLAQEAALSHLGSVTRPRLLKAETKRFRPPPVQQVEHTTVPGTRLLN